MHVNSEITIEDVLPLVPYQAKKAAGPSGEAIIYCPLQAKQELCLNMRTGQFKCFHECTGCPVGGKGRAINFYRLYNPNLSFKEAIEAIKKEQASPTYVHYETQLPKGYANISNDFLAPIEERHKTYCRLLDVLELDEPHKKDLKRRGLTDQQIAEFGIKSIPTMGIYSIPKQLQNEGYTLKGVPLFAKIKGSWILCTQKGKSGYLIPYFDIRGRIEQLQIRYDVDLMDNLSPEEIEKAKSSRYRWASSAAFNDGASARNIPFWGRIGKFKNSQSVFVTEGGLKAAIASYLSEEWFVAIPGVTCYEVFQKICKFCKKHNITMIDSFDMDGKILDTEHVLEDQNMLPANLCTEEIREELSHSNRILIVANDNSYCRVIKKSVKNALDKLHQYAEKENVEFLEQKWDFRYKGIDDYLLALHNGAQNEAAQLQTADNHSEETNNQCPIADEVGQEEWCQQSVLGPIFSKETGFCDGTFIPSV